MSMFIEGGSCERIWHTCSVSAVLDMGKKAEPYLSTKPPIDTTGGSTNGNYACPVAV